MLQLTRRDVLLGRRFIDRLGSTELRRRLLVALPSVLSHDNLCGHGGWLHSQLASQSDASLRNYGPTTFVGRSRFLTVRNARHSNKHALGFALGDHGRRNRLLTRMGLRWALRIGWNEIPHKLR